VSADEEFDEFGIPIVAIGPNSSERKRQSIVDAALAEFVRSGYAGSSVDAIADRAGVSKPTVYKHFGSKERMFLHVVGCYLKASYTDLCPLGPEIAKNPSPRAGLIGYMRLWTDIVMRPDVMTLRRLVIGEVDRFPRLGEVWFRINERNDGALMAALQDLDEQGVLEVPDPLEAVRQLIAMTLGVPQLIKTFQPDYEPAAAELDRMVASGVDAFLSHYAGS
jgi:TetR/AcrR family transcriptional regulator of autoinduction and epiphytic fitness